MYDYSNKGDKYKNVPVVKKRPSQTKRDVRGKLVTDLRLHDVVTFSNDIEIRITEVSRGRFTAVITAPRDILINKKNETP